MFHLHVPGSRIVWYVGLSERKICHFWSSISQKLQKSLRKFIGKSLTVSRLIYMCVWLEILLFPVWKLPRAILQTISSFIWLSTWGLLLSYPLLLLLFVCFPDDLYNWDLLMFSSLLLVSNIKLQFFLLSRERRFCGHRLEFGLFNKLNSVFSLSLHSFSTTLKMFRENTLWVFKLLQRSVLPQVFESLLFSDPMPTNSACWHLRFFDFVDAV